MLELENNIKLGLLITAFISIILGAALISPLANETEKARTSTYTVANESVTISSGAGELTNDEVTDFTACRNSSMTTISTGIQCNVTESTGAVSVLPANFTDGLAYIDYTYSSDTGVHDSGSRALLGLNTLFFAIGIIAVSLLLILKSFSKLGL